MDHPLSLFTLIMVVAFITFTIKKRRRKKSHLPEVDERVLQLYHSYLLRTIISSATIGVILLAIYTWTGRQSIPVSYIWIYPLITMFSLSLMTRVIKKNKRGEALPFTLFYQITTPDSNCSQTVIHPMPRSLRQKRP